MQQHINRFKFVLNVRNRILYVDIVVTDGVHIIATVFVSMLFTVGAVNDVNELGLF